MKKILLTLAFIPSLALSSSCLDLNGTWKGLCDRDGSVKEESITIRQKGCGQITFYSIDYKIGMPYEQRHENTYERMTNIYNLYWGKDGQSLFFDVDRIRWMKHKNIVSTGEGVGVIRVSGDEMSYSRSYSARSREGVYSKSSRKCDFVKEN
ncbi:MAG: hypothetical protein BM556_05930 [Bacteriovorax sp. MedPE-SWde]|nr:MAG: hypothetical protein BM556_05930 [Bacteriovorax sp. MedPE-SWde]